MTPKPGLDLYRHKKTGGFIILNYAPNRTYGFSVACGPFVRISADDLMANGINQILHNLDEFESRDAMSGSEFKQLSSANKRKFEHDHDLVGLRRESPDQLVLTPMHPAHRGGFTGDQKEEIVVMLPCLAEQFHNYLTEAFRRSG
jgi:hypothetical protein